MQVAASGATSQTDLQALTSLKNADGMGWRVVAEFLAGIEGISKRTVTDQLANLKASGHYAAIIGIEKGQPPAMGDWPLD